MNRNAGFTLIELVMVIVILGILSAVALPKFVDLSSDAKVAAAKGVAGALSAASAANYAARLANTTNGSAVANCTGVGTLVSPAIATTDITSLATSTGGTAVSCTVTVSGSTATFYGYGIT